MFFSVTDCEFTMSIDFILGGVVAAFLLAYLVYALVRPEKF